MIFPRKPSYVVAVVGATGAVGQEIVETLEERSFPVDTLRLFATEASRGKRVDFREGSIRVQTLSENAFQGVDLAFFAAGDACSAEWAAVAVRSGCLVIDHARRSRQDLTVPLVVAEINPEDLDRQGGLIASPGGATVLMVSVLKPLHDALHIRRVVATTLQAVSGAGMHALEELLHQTTDILNMREPQPGVFKHQVAFNMLPHVGAFLPDGSTEEEMSLGTESGRILGDDEIRIAATAVYVPVFRGHGLSLNIETAHPAGPDEIRALLAATPGVVVFDAPSKNVYPMPVYLAGKDDIFAGRIRKDESIENGLSLWIVADNLRRGAALNSVRIAEKLVEKAG